jgi:hypothetical protein
MSTLRRSRLQAGDSNREHFAGSGGCTASMHHPERLPLVFTGRRSRVQTLPRNHHGKLRSLGNDTRSFRLARDAGVITRSDQDRVAPRVPHFSCLMREVGISSSLSFERSEESAFCAASLFRSALRTAVTPSSCSNEDASARDRRRKRVPSGRRTGYRKSPCGSFRV